MSRTVAITGADGLIGSHLRAALRNNYQLKLLSLDPIPDVDEPQVQTDITDVEKLTEAFRGVDSVVHLAASPAVDTPWEQVLHNNIQGVYGVYEAASRAGVKQVIFASSNHAVGTYSDEWVQKVAEGEQHKLSHLILPLPDSYYGVSKAFGEALGAFYAYHRDLHVICIRIGWINPEDKPKGDPKSAGAAMWMSHDDFARLIDKCLQADQVQYDIFYGVSDNTNRFYDLKHAREVLGFVPQDTDTSA